MGYARYTVWRSGQQIEAGYDVEDVCNKDGCTAEIDRGLDYLCGRTPGGDEYGCGRYFCNEDMFLPGVDDVPQICASCLAAQQRQWCEEFADQLPEVLAAIPGVKSADVLADKPELFVELENGAQFTVKITT